MESLDNDLASAGVSGTKSQRLYLLLRDAILSGRLLAGSKLPGELQLAEQHGVSRVTVRRALEALKEAKLVARKPGMGTVVLDCPLESTVMTANVANLLPNIRKMGQTSKVRLLEFSYSLPDESIQQQLRLVPGEKTQRSVRVRQVADKPFSYLITHVPKRIAEHYSESDLSDTPLFELLERGGVVIDHATQTISAALATPELAEALQVAAGSPLLALTRVVYDVNGQGIEYLDAFYRPDRYRFQIDLNRTGNEHSRYWEPMPLPPPDDPQ